MICDQEERRCGLNSPRGIGDSFSKKIETNAGVWREYAVGNVRREEEVNHEIHEKTRKMDGKCER